jgi:hypothetical protein
MAALANPAPKVDAQSVKTNAILSNFIIFMVNSYSRTIKVNKCFVF